MHPPCSASITRFLKLKDVDAKSRAPPPVLVLHGRHGGCIGDLASYDAFTLGGPYRSVNHRAPRECNPRREPQCDRRGGAARLSAHDVDLLRLAAHPRPQRRQH